jgi:hypothetical protein
MDAEATGRQQDGGDTRHMIVEQSGEAPRKRGEKFHGKPCEQCGGSERYTRSGRCVECGKKKSKDAYYNNREYFVKANKEWHIKNKERVSERSRKQWLKDKATGGTRHHAYNIRKKYGMSPADYADMLKEQDGKCAICEQEPKSKRRMAVDHCHKSGRVRRLLCAQCNTGIGSFGDDALLLRRAVAYLEQWAETPCLTI